MEWADNLTISDTAPKDNFPPFFEKLTDQQKAETAYWHALPDSWTSLEYTEFLAQRRKLIAGVIRDGYRVLTEDVVASAEKIA